MNLIVDFDQNASSLPTGFTNAVNYVVNYYDQLFTANVNVTIDVGYGEIDGQRLESGALGESEQLTVAAVSYTSARNALIAENAPGASTLPASPPSGSPGTLYMTSAEEKALGLIANDNSLDGYAGFSSVRNIFGYTVGTAPPSNEYYFVGVVEHEFSEIMGRVSYLDYSGAYSLMDLFRYAGPNSRQFTTGDASYFSVNNGQTNLDNWNNFQTGNGGDLGDWGPSAGYDAFDDNSYPGVVNAVTSADTTVMAALGWNPSGSSSPPSNSGPPASTAGLRFIGVGGFGIGPTAGLAWQTNGQVEVWTNNGNGLAASLVPNGAMGAEWAASGVVDFHTGSDDIVWSNGTGGQAAVWQLNGSSFAGFGVSAGRMGSEWSIAATGDFAGNGNADILWRDTNQLAVWYLNGTGLASYGIINGGVGSQTHVVATGDFFQTGSASLLWEDAGSGVLQAWSLSGTSVNGVATVGQMGADWEVAGVGQFAGIGGGDSTGDIVWVNANTNNTQIWQMSGGRIAAMVNLDGHDGSEWTLQGVGDFTDTGESQLLWLDGNGDAQIWQINGAQVSTISTHAPAGTSGADATGAAIPGAFSLGDVDNLQYIAPGVTVTNPVIADGVLQLASGAIVDGTVTFAPGSTGTLFDSDQATLPDTVVGFNEGRTFLSFSGENATAEAQVIASAQASGGNTVLTFPDHTSIVLAGLARVDMGIFT